MYTLIILHSYISYYGLYIILYYIILYYIILYYIILYYIILYYSSRKYCNFVSRYTFGCPLLLATKLCVCVVCICVCACGVVFFLIHLFTSMLHY